jgi:quercetin dioxygenase-like cupin family protein
MTEARGDFQALPVEEPYPGVRKRSFDSDGATVNEYRFDQDASFPVHRHPDEQITIVDEGEIELTLADEQTVLAAGAWVVIAPFVPHGIRARSDGARILAVIVPRRQSPVEVTG